MKWLRWGWQQLSVHGLWDADQEIVLFPKAPAAETKTVDENTKEV